MTDTAREGHSVEQVLPRAPKSTAPRTGFFWPLGVWYFLAAFVVIAGVTLVRTSLELSFAYEEWAHTNGLFQRSALDITGPLAAAFGAYLSGRLTPPSRPYALPRFARSKAEFLAHHLLPAATVVTAGYVLGLVPIVVKTYSTATTGSLAPLGFVIGIVILNTLLVLGWLFGVVAQSAFAAPIAFAAGFAATLCGYGIGAWNSVTPVVGDVSTAGRVETLAFALFRGAFFAIVLVAALATAAGVLRTRGFQRRLPPVRVFAWWILPAVLLAVGMVRPPSPAVREVNPPKICKEAVGMSFCVHQAHERDLDDLVAEVEPIVVLVGQENLPFTRVEDTALHDGANPHLDPTVYYADVSPRYGATGDRDIIANLIAGSETCFVRPGWEQSAPGYNAFMLTLRLSGDRESGADKRFGKLSDKQVHQWLNSHRNQIRGCAITDDLLP
ncbi:hypothetical protein [Actinoplanes palleronii]|uniref:ABC transporter permease n=1 Tax=Actinoplanes palleronii TaxID=113570 RepID=A0ABQ4BQZ6_9ACTN|nr:hypothetical protein [Actinoplanes palleronii]GIE73074.1 hypothetical protein Apa02nite_091820 [Actinoplanes palleronii]